MDVGMGAGGGGVGDGEEMWAPLCRAGFRRSPSFGHGFVGEDERHSTPP